MHADMDIHKILEIMPHRYPFLLIDRIIEYTAYESITAIKNVTINEPYFSGHFPSGPIMPGVLILESMAQATGMLAFYSHGTSGSNDARYYLVGVDRARFKAPVVPGDQLVVEARLKRQIRGIYTFAATARVDDRTVATAGFMTTEMTADRDQSV